ncbi:tetratricopeptide repeat protein [Lentzea sp. JNUCC 0626]|uniref:tetratricopeptide repeat protein n=1 Tax=Lentzea sp. JNUCC 0626 TaxID=3367513 RepID=UPI003747C684
MSDPHGFPGRPADQEHAGVAVWRSQADLPTHARRAPQHRPYRDYPLLTTDGVAAKPHLAPWAVVHMENPWVRVGVLPGAGGLVHVAWDLLTGRHLLAPQPLAWTPPPADVEVEQDEDGAVTTWFSRHDPVSGLKLMHGIRLRPDNSALELRSRVYNESECPRPLRWDETDFVHVQPEQVSNTAHVPPPEPFRAGVLLQPGETLKFSAFWFGANGVGRVRAATEHAALHVMQGRGRVNIGLVATSHRQGCVVEAWSRRGQKLATCVVDVLPREPQLRALPVPRGDEHQIGLVRVTHNGEELVRARLPSQPLLAPQPTPSRTNAPPWQLYERGEFEAAQSRLDSRKQDDAYLLGLVHERCGRHPEAADSYRDAVESARWRVPARYRLARLLALAGRHEHALVVVTKVLADDHDHLQAHALRVILSRRLGRTEQAGSALAEALRVDPTYRWARDLAGLPCAPDPHACYDLAHEYLGTGEHEASLRLFGAAADSDHERDPRQPSVAYLARHRRARLFQVLGRFDESAEEILAADSRDCVPFRLDDLDLLEATTEEDTSAMFLRGLWYHGHGRVDDAIFTWRQTKSLHSRDARLWRCLGLSSQDDLPYARVCFDIALALAPDPVLVWESDQLDARSGVLPAFRLHALRHRGAAVELTDELALAMADLLLTTGAVAEAEELMNGHEFHSDETAVLARTWARLGALQVPTGNLRFPARSLRLRTTPRDLPALYFRLGSRLLEADSGAARRAWALAVPPGEFDRPEQAFWSVLALRGLGRHVDAQSIRDRLRSFCDDLAVSTAVTSSGEPFPDDPIAAHGRNVLLLRTQLDLLDGRTDLAAEKLTMLLQEEPAHADAMDLADWMTSGRPG